MTSQLDDVNELIRMKKGDLFRLEHIKTTLESRKILYISDRKYLEELTKTYLNSSIPKEKLPKYNKYDYPEYQKRIDSTQTTSKSDVEPSKTPEVSKIPEPPPRINVEPEKTHGTFCSNCGNPITSENFCPKCGHQINSKSNSKSTKPKIPTPMNQNANYGKVRAANKFVAAIVGIFGIAVFFIGIALLSSSLEMPAIFAGQYLIFGLFVMIIGAVIIYVASRIGKKKSHFICGFCGYHALTDRELYNHSLVCEKKLAEENQS